MNTVAIVTKCLGQAFAERDGKTVALEANTAIFAEDIISTGIDAKLEIHFEDDAIISLGPDTRIEIKDFVYDPTGEVEPSFFLNMLEGVVRSVSGKVVEQNPEAFKLTSPLGTVGIRGTETVHDITPKYEVHSVLTIDNGHTVVISTVDGRTIVLSESLEGVRLSLGDDAPLQLLNFTPEMLEESLHQLQIDGHSFNTSAGYFVLADIASEAAESALDANSFLGFVAASETESLWTRLENTLGELGHNGEKILGSVVFSQGLNAYHSSSGSLLSSVDRLNAAGEPWSWGGGRLGSALSLDTPALTAVVSPPSAEFSLAAGLYYLGPNAVLESDPFGIQLAINLSTPASGQPIVMAFGGSAQMGIHYQNPSSWQIMDAHGNVITGWSITDLGGGQVSINLPFGVKGFRLQVPVEDMNDSTAGPYQSFTYQVLSAGSYVLHNPTGVVKIINDSHAQEYGWVAPSPGDTSYTDPNVPGPKGVMVQVTFADPASAAVLENIGTAQVYNVEILNVCTGSAYSSPLTEDLVVTLQLIGKNGLDLTQDFTFNFSGLPANAVYNSATGEITFTILSGSIPSSTLNFTGTPIGSANIQAGTSPDALQVVVAEVVGNESIKGDGVITEVIDLPIVSVSASETHIAESADASMPNTVTYTFTLTSPMVGDLDVDLNWSGTGNHFSSSDFVLADGSPLPTTITFPDGTTTYTVVVKSVDNTVSELGNKTLNVAISPPTPSDNYYVGDGSNGREGNVDVVLVEDSGTGLDGPLVQLILTDAMGDPLSDSAANSIMENGGQVHYKLTLVNPDGTPYTDTRTQDIDVTLKADGLGGGTLSGGGTDYTFADGMGGSGWQYNPATGSITVTIPSGQNSITFSGTSTADRTPEGPGASLGEPQESVTLVIESVWGNEAIVDAGHKETTSTIVDVPTASIVADATHYSESGSTEISYTVNLTSPVLEDTVINISWSGTSGVSDHGTLPSTVTILAGETSAKIIVPMIDDALSENNETLIVTLGPQNSGGLVTDDYHVGTGNSATAVIVDDIQNWDVGLHGPKPEGHGTLHGPVVQLVLTDNAGLPLSDSAANSIMENGGQVYYKLNLVNADGTPYTGERENISVTLQADGLGGGTLSGGGSDYTFANGTGGSGWQYNPATGSITVTIPSGQNSITFSGTSTADRTPEGPGASLGAPQESVTLVIESVTGNESSIDQGHKGTTSTIIDVPTASIVSDATHYSESGGSDVTYTVNLTSPVPHDTVIQLTWGGTASSGADYSGAPTSVTILAGQTTAEFTIHVKDDDRTESNEVISVTLKPQTGTGGLTDGYHVDGTKGSVSVTIVDDSTPWDPGFGEEPAGHGESAYSGPVLKLFAVSGDVSGGSDDREAVVMEDNASGQNGSITYRVGCFDRDDGETLINTGQPIVLVLDVSTLGGATYGTDFVIDLAAMNAKGLNASYNGGKLTLTIPQGKSFVDIPVIVTADGFTEYERNEYDAQGNLVGPLANEGFTLVIDSVTGNEATVMENKGTIETTIAEEHTSTQVSIEAVNATNIAEGGQAEFILRLSQAASEKVVVVLEANGDGSDFQGSTLRFEIPAGSTSLTINVDVFNDIFGEGSENFTLKIIDVIGGEAIVNSQLPTVSGTIKDDMNGPKLSITGDASVNESSGGAGNSLAEYTVHIDNSHIDPSLGAPVEAIDVVIKLVGGTGITVGVNGDVFFANLQSGLESQGLQLISSSGGSFTVRIPAGYEHGSFTFPVNIGDDPLTEGNETYSVVIEKIITSSDAPGSEATIKPGGGSANTTIVDDSITTFDGPYLHLEGTTLISESGGYATYTLELRDPVTGELYTADQDVVITLNYKAMPDADDLTGAKPTEDFEVLQEQYTVTIKAGQSSGEVNIRIADDKYSENNERFEVSVTSATGNEVRIQNPEDVRLETVIVDDTQPWPTNEQGIPLEGVGKDTHGSSSLDGPQVNLDMVTVVDEPEFGASGTEVVMSLNLTGAPEQDVTITVHIEASGSDFSLDDFMLGADADPSLLDAVSGTSNWRVAESPATGWFFDVVVPKDGTSATIKLPVANDDLTENDSRFTTSIHEVKGAEASIGGKNSAETIIHDDGVGPEISLNILDYNADGSCSWGKEGSFPHSYVPDPNDGMDYDSAGQVYFKVASSRPVVEDTEVEFIIYNSNMDTLDKEGITGATKDGSGSGTVYKVIIKAGESEAIFTLPKTPVDPNDLSQGYQSDHYFVKITDTEYSESQIKEGGNIVQAELHGSGGEGAPRPSLSLSTSDGSADEGNEATFTLNIGNSQLIQAPFTVTIKVDGISNGFSYDDIDIDQFGLGAYANYTWNAAKGIITIANVSPGQTSVNFKLPMKTDTLYEGPEQYSLTLIGSTAGAHINTSSVIGNIVDVFSSPILSLHQVGVAEEGGEATYCLEVDKEPQGDVFVTLSFANGSGSNNATSGLDYTPISHPIIIEQGTWVKVGEGASAVWRYEVKVPLPNDELTEGDESFIVKIDTHSPELVVDTSHEQVETEIKDVLEGPEVSFGSVTTQCDEANTVDLKFEIVLTRPAVENVEVIIEIIEGTTTYGMDYDLSSFPGYFTSGGKHFISINVPVGKVQVDLNLASIFINDQFTEGNENFTIKIVDVTGGEVSIDSGKSSANITVLDVLDGPQVSVTADKSVISEADAGTAAADITYTFKLPGAEIALEDVVITFSVRSVHGVNAADGIPLGEYTITIPAGSNGFIWHLPAGFVQDKFDEQSPNQDVFELVITSVTGNEASGVGEKVVTTIIDDDHKPVTTPDKIVILVPPKPGTATWTVNVLENDSDLDGDPLATIAGATGGERYGTYSIDGSGNLSYQLDGSITAIKNLTEGQTLHEVDYKYQVTDGFNPVESSTSLEIAAKATYVGSTSAEWIMGSARAENISGNGGKDVIHGGDGNDTIHIHNDGLGQFFGDAGNDTFLVTPKSGSVINPNDFGIIGGGNGVDCIQMKGTGQTLDFTVSGWNGSNITGIERIDITGSGNNTIKLDSASLKKLTDGMDDTTQPLCIIGNAGDSFDLVGTGWTVQGTVDLGTDGIFTHLTDSAGNSVLVHNDMALLVNGTASGDVITVGSLANGSTGNFHVLAGDGNDTITGGAGNDWIYGGKGNDVIDGGAGTDVIDAGEGADKIYLRDTTGDAIINASDIKSIAGGLGNDTLALTNSSADTGLTLNFLTGLGSSITGIEVIDISGDVGKTNAIHLNAAGFTALANGMDDGGILRITGKAGDVFTLCGTTIGTPGSWQYTGIVNDGAVDWYSYTLGGKTLYVDSALTREMVGTESANTLTASAENTILTGLGGNDKLTGGTGNDTLRGGLGNDTLDGGMGLNLLDGGDGNDVLILRDINGDDVISSTDLNHFDGGAGSDTLKLTNSDADNGLNLDFVNGLAGSISQIEVIDISGSEGKANSICLNEAAFASLSASMTNTELRIIGKVGDTFTLCGTTLNSIGSWNYEGTVSFNGSWYKYTCNGNILYVSTNLTREVWGTSGADTLTVVGEQSIIHGYAGNDTITGGAGNDTLYGGLGDDVIVGGDGANLLYGDDGNDQLTGGIGNDTLYGGIGNDTLHGGGGTNILHGDDGNDSLYNESTADKLYGDAGNDTFALGDVNNDGKITGNDFGLIDGGGDVDTIQLTGTDLTLDLTSLATGKITGIENIDLTGSGVNHMLMDANTLTQMGVTLGQPVTVTGDVVDTFTLDGTWTYGGKNGAYHIYTDAQGLELRVDDTMTHIMNAESTGSLLVNNTATDRLMGGIGDDVFTLADIDNSGSFTDADFGLISGGGGFDTLQLGAGTLDLRTLSAGKISNIESFELGEGSVLTLDAATIASISSSTDLYITVSNGATTAALNKVDVDWEMNGASVVNGIDYIEYTIQHNDAELHLYIQATLLD